ncbi:hypothetical protein Taro_032470 [Colocasia esculenta]|uniref:Uncharacterized protein n=1 Tax=Colocasia esculenta TaxID=4460 RepID=A0A843W675_COLES|nr:hypothetical protein [Colocasia esculenta]
MSRRSARIQVQSSSVAEPEGASVDGHEGAGVDRREEDRVDTAGGRTVERLVAPPPRSHTNADPIPRKIYSMQTSAKAPETPPQFFQIFGLEFHDHLMAGNWKRGLGGVATGAHLGGVPDSRRKGPRWWHLRLGPGEGQRLRAAAPRAGGHSSAAMGQARA